MHSTAYPCSHFSPQRILVTTVVHWASAYDQGPVRGYGSGYGTFVEKIIGIRDTKGKNYRDMGYQRKKLQGYGMPKEKRYRDTGHRRKKL